MGDPNDFVVVVEPQSFAAADRQFEEWLSDRGQRLGDIADDDIRVDFMRDAQRKSAKRYLVRRSVLTRGHNRPTEPTSREDR